MDPDPITQFFPDQEDVDLYGVLELGSTATPEEIKKSYRRLALAHHPDKHTSASDSAKRATSLKFQQIGYAYTVLGDATRRARYDATGRTDQGLLSGVADSEGGWEAYFEAVFEKVSRERLDEDKARYQGSEEEKADIITAYKSTKGSLPAIMSHIPHISYTDEPRLVTLVNSLIASGELPCLPAWDKSAKDERARKARKKAGEKEAKEAEEAAKALGVWDEFFGSGKPTAKASKSASKSKGTGKGSDQGGEEEAAEVDNENDRESRLKALIQRKANKMDSFFDGLAAKYGGGEPSASTSKGKGKTRAKKRTEPEADADSEDGKNPREEEGGSPKKKSRTMNGKNKGIPPPPDIDDAEFAALQARMFGDRGKSKKDGASSESNPGGREKGVRSKRKQHS